MRVRIYLKSGSSFEFEATEFEARNSPVSNEIAAIKWAGDARQLPLYVNLSEVEAVVRCD